MARKVIDMARTGPWAQRWAVRVSLMFIVAVGLIFVRTLLAVHNTGAFELDGNASECSLTGPDDWDRVCYEEAIKEGLDPTDATDRCTATGGTEIGGDPAIAVAWTAESARAATIFTGGGSKDPQDISDWAWKNDPTCRRRAPRRLAGQGQPPARLRSPLLARPHGAWANGPGTCPNGTAIWMATATIPK